MKHVVCYSGGHSSAIVAIEVVKKFGAENTVLLNHDISSWVESADIKRFKVQVANYLGVPITYANIKNINGDELPDQFDVTVAASAFKVGSGTELCTSRLKTEPFMEYLNSNFPERDCIIYYGFDLNEKARIQRRTGILGVQGFKTDYPLAFWKQTIYSTLEIGIQPPNQYEDFKHANCIGCLKAGKQHWYIVYCKRPDVYKKAMWAEDEIGYTIIKGSTLKEMIPVFEEMKNAEVITSEHVPQQRFWANVKKMGVNTQPTSEDLKPCECIF